MRLEVRLVRQQSRALAAFCVLVVAGSSHAGTLIVPDDYPDIQQAIDAAENGDLIQVRAGWYTGSIEFDGRAITLESIDGPGVTIIDANSEGPVLSFVSGEGPDTVVRGFTLTGGIGQPDFLNHGGAIYCAGTSPQIIGNVIHDNHVNGDGGAVYCRSGGAPVFRDNVIHGNTTEWYAGGAFYCKDVTLTLENNIISQNDGNTSGGAMFMRNCTATLIGNTINFNVTGDDGGGIKAENCDLTLIDNEISHNVADDLGGAIDAGGTTLVMTGNVIVGNVCNSRGGGVNAQGYETAEFTGNTFIDNDASGIGGGLRCYAVTNVSVIDNTFSGNISFGHGGGLDVTEATDLLIRGNTFTENVSLSEGGGVNIEGQGVALIVENEFVGNLATGGGTGGKGGGIRCTMSSSYIANNVVTDNTVFDRGGGIFVMSETTLVGNLVARNKCVWTGGGIDCHQAAAEIINCTIVDNIGGEKAGGVLCAASAVIRNTIIRGNVASVGEPVWDHEQHASPLIEHCNLNDTVEGVGNVDLEHGLDYAFATNDCATGIDLGSTAALPPDLADLDGDGDLTEPIPFDIAGNPRVVGTVDIGAHELPAGGLPCPDHLDCNSNGVLDTIDIENCDGSAWCQDCNDNGRPDACDLVETGPSFDPGVAYWRFEDTTDDLGPCDLPTQLNQAVYDSDVPHSTVPRNGAFNTRSLRLGGVGRAFAADEWKLTALGSEDPQDFTIEAWVKLDELSNGSNRQCLVQKKVPGENDTQHDYTFLVQGGAAQQGMQYNFGKTSGFTGHELVIYFGDVSSMWSVTSALEITDLQWHHVHVSYRHDGGQPTFRFGLDDAVDEVTLQEDRGRFHDIWGQFLIGAHRSGDGSINQQISGAIDEVRVSHRFLRHGELLNAFPPGRGGDCNGNGLPDDCDIANGTSEDLDGDGIPDDCVGACVGDIDGSGAVDVEDLLVILANWGSPYTVDDLLVVLANFGACP